MLWRDRRKDHGLYAERMSDRAKVLRIQRNRVSNSARPIFVIVRQRSNVENRDALRIRLIHCTGDQCLQLAKSRFDGSDKVGVPCRPGCKVLWGDSQVMRKPQTNKQRGGFKSGL